MSRWFTCVAMLAAIAACKFPPLPDIEDDGGDDVEDGAPSDGPAPDAGLRTVMVTVDPLVGSGVVVANVGGIDCGTTCSAEVLDGVSITFMANPASGAAFVHRRRRHLQRYR